MVLFFIIYIWHFEGGGQSLGTPVWDSSLKAVTREKGWELLFAIHVVLLITLCMTWFQLQMISGHFMFIISHNPMSIPQQPL